MFTDGQTNSIHPVDHSSKCIEKLGQSRLMSSNRLEAKFGKVNDQLIN